MQRRLLWTIIFAVLASGCGSGGCWTTKTVDPVEPPPTVLSEAFGCRIEEGSAACWGAEDNIPELEGNVVQLDASAEALCALTVAGRIECSDPTSSAGDAPSDLELTEFSISENWGCGIRKDGTVRCWGLYFDASGQLAEEVSSGTSFAAPPSGPFVQIDTGRQHACGLRPSGRIDCWGRTWHGLTEPPNGRYLQVASGRYHNCALAPDGQIACWGLGDERGRDEELHEKGDQTAGNNGKKERLMRDRQRDFDQALPPEGAYLQIAAGPFHNCAVSRGQRLDCWGRNIDFESNPPSGRFVAVAAGLGNSCGRRKEKGLVCWGDNTGGRSTPPDGSFWHHTGPPLEGKTWSLPESDAAQPADDDIPGIQVTSESFRAAGTRWEAPEKAVTATARSADDGSRIGLTAGRCTAYDRVAEILEHLGRRELAAIDVAARKPASNRVGILRARTETGAKPPDGATNGEPGDAPPSPVIDVGPQQIELVSESGPKERSRPDWTDGNPIEAAAAGEAFDEACTLVRDGGLRKGGAKMREVLESFQFAKLQEQLGRVPSSARESGLRVRAEPSTPWELIVRVLELAAEEGRQRPTLVP